jgi:hypothetical protein
LYRELDRHQPILDPVAARATARRSGDQVMHAPNDQKGRDHHQHDERNDA